jgi:hypothetical protein
VATIRDYVRTYLPATYDKLTNEGMLDANERPDAVGLAIDTTIETLLVPDTDVDDLSEFARRYIAAVATLSLIPTAIDYYMVQTRLSDALDRPPGVTPLGGERSQNYNRVDALKEIEARIFRWVADNEARFVETVGDSVLISLTATTVGIAVSGNGQFLTDNPQKAFSKPSSRESQVLFGNLIVSSN